MLKHVQLRHMLSLQYPTEGRVRAIVQQVISLSIDSGVNATLLGIPTPQMEKNTPTINYSQICCQGLNQASNM